MDKDIGRIVEVRGINVKAKLFRLLPPYLINNGIIYIIKLIYKEILICLMMIL